MIVDDRIKPILDSFEIIFEVTLGQIVLLAFLSMIVVLLRQALVLQRIDKRGHFRILLSIFCD